MSLCVLAPSSLFFVGKYYINTIITKYSSRFHKRATNLELNFELCRRCQNQSTQVLDNNSTHDHIWHSLVLRLDPSDSPRSPGLRILGIP